MEGGSQAQDHGQAIYAKIRYSVSSTFATGCRVMIICLFNELRFLVSSGIPESRLHQEPKKAPVCKPFSTDWLYSQKLFSLSALSSDCLRIMHLYIVE